MRRQPFDHLSPSRRAVLGTGAMMALTGVGNSDSADRSVADCERWLATNAEIESLSGRWAKLEDHLVKRHRWLKLTERQRCALPEAQDLFDIDERLEVLHAERDALLRRLPTIQAMSVRGLAGKLAVAAVAIAPDDHEDVHHLIASILRDLKMMPNGAA